MAIYVLNQAELQTSAVCLPHHCPLLPLNNVVFIIVNILMIIKNAEMVVIKSSQLEF